MRLEDYDFSDKAIFITGGTGSFGKRLVKRLLGAPKGPRKIIIFSRDELKQFELRRALSSEDLLKCRFFIGDVRDVSRLKLAIKDADVVIHAAAMKQVDTAEYNPTEAIATNVMGAQNVIAATLESNVKSVVALSTDKACAPANLYGATKLVSDKLFVAANNLVGHKPIKFAVVRYGNVFGSRGSVVPFFLSQRDTGRIPVTDMAMTRFNITLDQGIDLVVEAVARSIGGEVFVPKIPSYKLSDVVKAVVPDCRVELIGMRPGEKLHEEMISESDSYSTIETSKYYLILPEIAFNVSRSQYLAHHDGTPVAKGFRYNSGTNTRWSTVQELAELADFYC